MARRGESAQEDIDLELDEMDATEESPLTTASPSVAATQLAVAAPPATKPPVSTGRVAAIIASYWCISISLVFANKLLVSDDNKASTIPAPLFVTWYQCFVTVILVYALGTLDGSVPLFHEFVPQAYSWPTGKRVLPLSVCFVGMMSVSNLCLKYVEVSFYQVARSLTIVFNVMLTFVLLGQRTSWRVCLCLCVVIAGFLAGAEGEVNFSIVGTVFGVSSSLLLALNGIYTKKTFSVVNNSHSTLVFYNNVHACFILPVVSVLTGEHLIIWENFDKLYEPMFWVLMNFSAVMGTMIGIVIVMQIQATSPLTSVISGTAKAGTQTVLALYVWGNSITATAALGVMMVLGGSMVYSIVKRWEDKQAKLAVASTAK